LVHEGRTGVATYALTRLAEQAPTSGHPKVDELVFLVRVAQVQHRDPARVFAVMFMHLLGQDPAGVTGVCADALLRLVDTAKPST